MVHQSPNPPHLTQAVRPARGAFVFYTFESPPSDPFMCEIYGGDSRNEVRMNLWNVREIDSENGDSIVVRCLIATVVVLAGLSLPQSSMSGEPGWVGQVVKGPAERARLEQIPIIHRPYRPLHFYGNTVRRMHYHGRVVPGPAEIRTGFRAFSR